ncbi:MAG: DNA-3-methyladenine glycosylase 2 family protein [Candidatus Rokubacteria bacterium]|nr:DNA-3-methyladenine glycosylase 2 family protein [Candidatus Rokubacteria bacterium]
MRFVLPVNGPLDVGATLARYHVWGDDPANRVGDGIFRRVLRLDGRLWLWEARWRGPVDDVRLDVTVPGARSSRVEDAVRAEVEKIFGLGFDLEGFYRFAKSDRMLAGLVVPLHGMRPTLAPNGLEMIVGSITAQQVNLAFAFACRARLVTRYGTPVAVDGDSVYAFPDAAALAASRVSELRAMKFSTRKAEYIRDLGRAVVDGALDVDAFTAATNDVVVDRITGLRGLGRWTAEWYLARCLGRGDVCPAGDLGVRRAFERYDGRGRALSEDAVRRRARAWGPYRNLAVHYLLAGLRLGLPAGTAG